MSRANLTAAVAVLALLAGATDAHAQLPRVNVQAIDLLAPSAAVAGEPMRVRIRAVATGNAVRLRFSWTLYLTVGGVVTGAREIGTLGPVAADAGIVTAAEGTVTLPDDMSGSYFVVAVADGLGEIVEVNELDNAAVAGGTTRVRPRAPDLVLSRVTLSETVRAAGETFGVQITVENRGEEAATADVSARLSVNPVPSRGDPEIGNGTITVAPGQTLTTEITATVPAQASAGDYQIGVLIDPELLVEEIDDNNNLLVAADALNVRSDRLALLTPTLPIGNVFMPYRASFESEGGDGHYRYRITSGVLPRGLVLDGATGLLSGEPRESGNKTVTIEVQSAGMSDSKSYELDVRRSVLDLTITTPALDRATVSVAYQVPLLAAGGEPPYTWTLVDGALPPGLDLSTGGSLSGIPLADGSYTFAVQVRDTFGARDQGELTLLVETPNVVVQTTTLPPLKVGEQVSYSLSASGGVPPTNGRCSRRLRRASP